ncbi:MAG: hypothetical protein ACREJ4_04335 [Candidatus Methylomirabilaceae bacterium]
MAPEPLSGQELETLHERITRAAAELRLRARPRPGGLHLSDDVLRLAEATLRSVHVRPRLIAGVTAAALVVAGFAAIMAVRSRRT